MEIKPVSSPNLIENAPNVNANKRKGKDSRAAAPETPEAAAVFEKSDDRLASKGLYTRDSATLSEIYRQTELRYKTFRQMIEKLVSEQAVKFGISRGLNYDQIFEKYDGELKSFYQNLQVDDATRLTAQQDISEDGFWGVKQTAARLVQFAIAISGGDKSKLNELKAAIGKGFSEAEKSWGGSLPDICYQTRAAAMKALDDWANGTE